jgi:hypothetical protein
MTSLYAIFHLNLMFSSVEEEQRADVIERCYWPLLRLIENLGLPLGIEAPGYTLEEIQSIDPSWIHRLRTLLESNRCEFIGSGYAQLIGPLVPGTVNSANQRLGLEVYQRLLGARPILALVNEMAFSSGLVAHYLEAGYKGIIMEWDNPALQHPKWLPEWQYLPQRALGVRGETIPLIWSHSIAFQAFQRWAHGEMEMEQYLTFLRRHVKPTPSALALYSNDAEVFDFRPGRYKAESPLAKEGEWARIQQLFELLKADPHIEIVLPSSVLALLDQPQAGNQLHLESPEDPIPVKKQKKYNISRWAVTGWDDASINAACSRIYKALESSPNADEADWRELCYLWSSDFRTHITLRRWFVFNQRLSAFEQRVIGEEKAIAASSPSGSPAKSLVERMGRFLTIENPQVKIRLNCRRGLAIDALWFGDVSREPLIGTVPLGQYDDISLGADFYSGHLVWQGPGSAQITDLDPAEPSVDEQAREGVVNVEARIATPLGPVEKRLTVSLLEPRVELNYRIAWPTIPVGLMRLGFITLNPAAFDQASLYFRTHNGGNVMETFNLAGSTVNHGEAASLLVSASHGLGMTEGVVEMGDALTTLRVEVDRGLAAVLGMVTYKETPDSFFYRLSFSVREVDETVRPQEQGQPIAPIHARIVLTTH